MAIASGTICVPCRVLAAGDLSRSDRRNLGCAAGSLSFRTTRPFSPTSRNHDTHCETLSRCCCSPGDDVWDAGAGHSGMEGGKSPGTSNARRGGRFRWIGIAKGRTQLRRGSPVVQCSGRSNHYRCKSSWIQNAVAELKAFVSEELRRQLDERVIEQLQADLQGVIINLHQYASLRSSSRQRNKYLILATW